MQAGQLIDRNGVPYAVLHQFDRHESLKQEILDPVSAQLP